MIVVTICICWGLFELMGNSVGFAMIFLAAGFYAAYRLFVTFDPEKGERE